MTGIGAKLKSTWSGEVLTNKRRIRPELRLRMPHYPTSLVKPLAIGLAASDGIGPTVIVSFAPANGDWRLKLPKIGRNEEVALSIIPTQRIPGEIAKRTTLPLRHDGVCVMIWADSLRGL